MWERRWSVREPGVHTAQERDFRWFMWQPAERLCICAGDDGGLFPSGFLQEKYHKPGNLTQEDCFSTCQGSRSPNSGSGRITF